MHFAIDVKSFVTLCPPTSVSGYRTGSFEKPVEGSLRVFSNKKKNNKVRLETVSTNEMYIWVSFFTLLESTFSII